MKKRVLHRFVDYVKCELPIKDGDWPSHEEISDMLLTSPHFQALKDVGLPDGHAKETGRQSLESEVAYWIIQTMQRVESRWIDRKIHSCMGIKELEECITKEIGPLKEGYSDALTLIQIYYTRLNGSISNTLYYSGQVFGRAELEMMVPRIESPFYHRERIIENYLEQMKRAKPEGFREAVQVLNGEK